MPVPLGTTFFRSACVRTYHEALGESESAALAPPAARLLRAGSMQPVKVMRSATFGGSGWGVPGVGFPVLVPGSGGRCAPHRIVDSPSHATATPPPACIIMAILPVTQA